MAAPDDKRRAIAERARKPAHKIDRSAFLYMEDRDDNAADFAQCSDCCFLAPGKQCALIGIPVEHGWSCGLFVDGDYDGTPVKKRVSTAAAGLYRGDVRCENCRYGGATCALYTKLNAEFPGDFDLETKIKPQGCCNSFSPR